MGEIKIQEILDGDVIQNEVRNRDGEQILEEGTVLKKEYISLLQALGVEKVCIGERIIPKQSEKEEKNKKTKEKIKTHQQLFDEWTMELQQVLEQHVYGGKNSLHKIDTIAESIINEMDEIKDWKNIQGYFSDIYHQTIIETIYCLALAKKENLTEQQKKDIVYGCLLHDLGMRYITVEWKNRDLNQMTANEVFEYKRHTILAYTALEKEEWISDTAKQMVLFHHECKDGTGFPLRQKNNTIECKIIQVIDYYCTQVTGIACKKKNKEDVIKVLRKEAGKKFEKKIVEIFLDMI